MSPAATVCSVCGAQAGDDGALLTWCRDCDERGRPMWVCAACTREHIRAIEAKLDREWW